MADISAIPQNQLLGRLAGFLRFLEKDRPEFLPSQLGAMQAASKLMLPQASTVENLSYGNLPFAMPPSGTGAMIPQVKTGRKAEVADLLFHRADALLPWSRKVRLRFPLTFLNTNHVFTHGT